jgi:trehalose synthase
MREAPTTSRTLADYERYTDDERRRRIESAADSIADERVLHVNSTPSGGGVAEMLASVVPLSNSVGVDTDWLVMEAPDEFFEVTKNVHNGLQGDAEGLTRSMREVYREVTEENAVAPELEGYDTVILHDPQTLGMAPDLAARVDSTLVWRCHIDPTDATDEYVEFLSPYLEDVDRVVVSQPEFGEPFDAPQTVIPPAIDPLTEKNCPLEELDDEAAEAASLDSYPVDPDRPLLVQISRFDPWKDPLGVVETYRRVAESVPAVQLALVGGMPDDDPEGMEVYREVEEATEDDPDVHLLTDLPDSGINGFQRGATVVLQKSLREGFALTVSEALWKRTPVVGSDVGGIPLQIADGENGYLVQPRDVETAADRCRRLVEDGDLRERLGEAGHETVRDRFLTTRLLLDFLELVADLR